MVNKGCENYKVGDRIKIRQDLKPLGVYGYREYMWIYEREMQHAAEQANFTGEIIGIYHGMLGKDGYRLNIIPDRPYFNDAMIEGYAEEPFNSADVLAFLDL